ncbi:MAG: SPOR domain-containing protein, partial [Comamonas sp.]|nr:SPOR domain-containing protein [Comamonas sp.]
AGAGLALLPARDATPQPAPMPAASATPVPAPAAAAAPAAKAEPQASAPAEPAASAPSPAVPEAKPAAPRSELEPGKFYLNVGVFADPANAGRALAQLEKTGLPVLTQTLPSNKGEATRVRSGPFDSRKRAEKAARKLQALDLDASIFQAAELASKK